MRKVGSCHSIIHTCKSISGLPIEPKDHNYRLLLFNRLRLMTSIFLEKNFMIQTSKLTWIKMILDVSDTLCFCPTKCMYILLTQVIYAELQGIQCVLHLPPDTCSSQTVIRPATHNTCHQHDVKIRDELV